jgi:site-specific DNA-methyltransferase (adenine-specific)
LQTNVIYNEDCLEGMKRIPDESIDIILTSPPYNIGKMHSNQQQFGTYSGNDMPESDYQQWQIAILAECYRVIKPEGSMFYNHKVRIKNGAAIHPLEWILKTEWVLKQEITWDMGKSANCDKIRFFPFSERIYWLAKHAKTKLNNINNLSDVWRHVPTHQRKNTGHIAVMPIEIATNCLQSVHGDIVLDPFMGSGTTAIACIKTGRKYIGFELDKRYYDIAQERIRKYTEPPPLFKDIGVD